MTGTTKERARDTENLKEVSQIRMVTLITSKVREISQIIPVRVQVPAIVVVKENIMKVRNVLLQMLNADHVEKLDIMQRSVRARRGHTTSRSAHQRALQQHHYTSKKMELQSTSRTWFPF